jgi:hypothetical protein
MPLRIADALDRWREAVRRLDAAQPGTAEWLKASEDAVLAKAAYYEATRQVGNEMIDREQRARNGPQQST